jgi:hypothetical protein
MGPMFAVQSSVGALFGLFIATAWPVALLIMLNTKTAKEALAPEANALRYEGIQEQSEGPRPGQE